MKKEELVKLAKVARENAYVPYSNFKVGAVVLMKDGQVFKGANIENASFSLSNCAERTAIFKAISEGYHVHDFLSIAIVADTTLPVSPCGACRQVISEFFDSKSTIYLANLKDDVVETSVEKLLPGAFTQEDMNESDK